MPNDIRATREIIDLITGGWKAQCLYIAVKLEIPDHIGAGRTTSAQIADATGKDRNGIVRLMRLLVALGVFAGTDATGYQNTRLSEMLRSGPDSLGDMCVLYGEEFYSAWGNAFAAVTERRSGFEIAFGSPLYQYLGTDPELAARFQKTMNTASMFFDSVPSALDLAGQTIVDVGGGGGELLSVLLKAHPSSRGVLYDRPHMMPEAREHLAEPISQGRASAVGGDMLVDVPSGGDVYFLSRVLAGWDDESVVRIFRNCAHAMTSQNARLVVLDRFVRDEDPTVLPPLWDLHLLVTTGGEHRTFDGITALLSKAGFQIESIEQLAMETVAVVATRK